MNLRLLPIFFFLGAALLADRPVCAAAAPADDVEPGEDEGLISETDEVELISDETVAESLRRRTDLRFQNVTIDGERSGASLSTIPAESVAALEVMKAVTPDQDADSRGGSVSLRSKPTFSLEKPVLRGEVKGAYSSSLNSIRPEAQLSFGRSFGDQFGFMLTGAYDRSSSEFDTLRLDWGKQLIAGEREIIPKTHEFSFSRGEHKQAEFNGTFDFKLNEQTSLYLRANYNRRNSEGINPGIEYWHDRGTYEIQEDGSYLSRDAKMARDLNAGPTQASSYGVTLGGYYDREGLAVDFRASQTENEESRSEYWVLDFLAEGIDLRYRIGPDGFPVTSVESGADMNDSSAFTFNELSHSSTGSRSGDLILAVNAKVPHSLADDGYFRSGLKLRDRDVDTNRDQSTYRGYDGSLRLSDVEADPVRSHVVDDRYFLGPYPDWRRFREFFFEHQDLFLYDERDSREDSDSRTYQATERISAAYAMAFLQVGRFSSIVGVRAEQTDTSYVGYEVVIDNQGQYDTTNRLSDGNSYRNYFPDLHMKYLSGNRLTVIGSWTNTIQRPPYSDLVPSRRIRQERQSIEEGNPRLRPTLYENFDLAFDYRLTESGIASIELFYKKVEDFIFRRKSIIDSGVYAGYERNRDENGGTADISGVELSWQDELSFLPAALEGFSVNANYVFTESVIEYPNRPGEMLELARKPAHELRLTLSYARASLYARLGYRRQGESLSRVGRSADEDLFGFAGDSWDLSANYKLNPKVKVVADFHNLTSQPRAFSYEGDQSRYSHWSSSSWGAKVGLRFDL